MMSRKLSLVAVGTVLGGMVLGGVLALAAGPGAPVRALPYHGHLDLSGVPVSGPVNMTFTLYDGPASDAAAVVLAGPIAQQVECFGGDFAVVLNSLPEGVFNAAQLWMGFTVEGSSFATRQQIFAAPQAVRAGQADVFTVTGGIRGGNTAGNLHLDANNPTGVDGSLYLNYFSGREVKFGNGANGVVASVNSTGDVAARAVTTSGDIRANGNLSSPKWNVSRHYNLGPLPKSFNFNSGGGRLLVLVAASSYGTAGNMMGVTLRIDGTYRENTIMMPNLSNVHMAPPLSMQLITNVGAGNHTMDLTALSGTITDVNDPFQITVIEFPF